MKKKNLKKKMMKKPYCIMFVFGFNGDVEDKMNSERIQQNLEKQKRRERVLGCNPKDEDSI